MPVSSLIAGSRMLTAEVLALTTSVEMQVAASTPPVRLAVLGRRSSAPLARHGRSGAGRRRLHPFRASARGRSAGTLSRWLTPDRATARAGSASGRGSARSRAERLAARAGAGARAQVPEQPPEAVLDFLRRLGVAMSRAGDSADRVTLILDDVATAYAAHGVSFFVLPTGVFVRIEAGRRPAASTSRRAATDAAAARPDRRAVPADRRHPARRGCPSARRATGCDGAHRRPTAVPAWVRSCSAPASSPSVWV